MEKCDDFFCRQMIKRIIDDNRNGTEMSSIMKMQGRLKQLIGHEAPERARSSAFWKTFEALRSGTLRNWLNIGAEGPKDKFEERPPLEIVMTAVFSLLIVHGFFKESKKGSLIPTAALYDIMSGREDSA